MDTFPYDSWEEAIQAARDGSFFLDLSSTNGYATFGPGGNASTIVLTVLGFLLMVAVLIAWIRYEDLKLTRQAGVIRARAGRAA